MTSRTDRILAAQTCEVEKHRPSLDADSQLLKLVVTIKLNDGGHPRAVWIERESFTDLTAAPRTHRLTNSMTAL